MLKKTEENIVLKYPLLPLRDIVVFPYMIVPLFVGREKSVNALEEAMLSERTILLATQKKASTDVPEEKDIYNIGTIAEILQLLKLPDGAIKVLVEGIARVRIKEYLPNDKFFQVIGEESEVNQEQTPEIEALMRNVIGQFEEYVKLNRKIPQETIISVSNVDEQGRLADIVAANLSLKVKEKQKILEALSPEKRLHKIAVILNNENEILSLEKRIRGNVRHQMEKTQREYYLNEQLKAIQKELGQEDERASEIKELEEKIKNAKMPQEAHEKAMKELGRLEKMQPMAAEATVVRNYLDWLVALPWSKRTRDKIDLKVALKILNEDHWGLEKIKGRILEYLAVRKLVKKKNMKGPILCFVGPPGVGKTSLARSIARSMGRKFVRISLGGVRDEAEIRGHRRTYIGAMPGRIIQSIRKGGSRNPVFLLDEVDKMSADFRGDPSSALLEVLDPEQNNTFNDHYLDVDFDLTDVMFITTANVLPMIPPPLRDRMEVVNLAGYTEMEKVNIAKFFLVGKQIKAHGLNNNLIHFSDSGIQKIIRGYTREAGVRNLERELASVCRKVAKKVVEKGKGKKTARTIITARNVHKFLGVQRFQERKKEEENDVGMATGLAWTEVGGEILETEVALMKGKGNLTLTGKLGEVMQESAQAAYSWVRSQSDELKIDEDFYRKKDIHIHVPEGAIPKDGPSAGVTLATALVSALTNIPTHRDVAMTGEITLRGKALAIGGLKEKVLAAHRFGIKTVIMPLANKRNMDDIPKNVRQEMNFTFAENIEDVLEAALTESPWKQPKTKKTTEQEAAVA